MVRRGFEAVAGLELPAGEFVEDEDGPLIWLSADAPLAEPSAIADWFCTRILAEGWLHDPRLALMPGESSGAALAASWWTPPGFILMASRVNVLRSWEERFGARIVALKPDSLYLSVSAPPVTREHAAHIACEHRD